MPHHDIASFLEVCGFYRGDQPSKMLLKLTGQFNHAASEDVSLIPVAASALPGLPPDGAAWLAITLGCLLEKDIAGAEVSGPPIVDLFLAWLPPFPAEPGQDGKPLPPGDEAWIRAFNQLCIAVVSFLARMPERREALSRKEPLLLQLEEMEEFSHGAAWVREALLRRSGDLVLLHAQSGTAHPLRYENVANCFHLFSLIQTTLGRRLPGGQRPDAKIAAAARGQSEARVRDEAWWHYGDPRSPTANLHASVWGESLVRDIPTIDGTQVIVLWPPVLASRSWDSDFFHPRLERLRPDVTLRGKLGNRETQAWFDLLKIPRARRAWWRWW